MIVSEPVPLGVRIFGFDCLSKLDTVRAKSLSAFGLTFGCRYVDLVDGTTPTTLDEVEVDDVLSHLPLMTVQFARSHGWSSAVGHNDGAAAARNHLMLGFPTDSTLSCDLEGRLQSAQQAIDYASAWYEAALSQGMHPDPLQLYVGDGVPLSSAQLYHELPFRGYWKSGSDVPDVAVRGYRMIQLRPLDQTLAGVRVDLDVVQTDYLGSRPRWARRI